MIFTFERTRLLSVKSYVACSVKEPHLWVEKEHHCLKVQVPLCFSSQKGEFVPDEELFPPFLKLCTDI